MTKTGDDAALVLQDMSVQKSVFTLELIYDDLPSVKNFRMLGFESNKKLELLSVSSAEKSVSLPSAGPAPAAAKECEIRDNNIEWWCPDKYGRYFSK